MSTFFAKAQLSIQRGARLVRSLFDVPGVLALPGAPSAQVPHCAAKPVSEAPVVNAGTIESDPSTPLSLLRGLKAGDATSWQRLVSLYGPLVYRWCRHAGLQPADAADVGQEVFRAVARGMDEFHRNEPGDTLCGWIRTITRHKICDFHRARAAAPAQASCPSDLPAPSESSLSSGDKQQPAPDQGIFCRQALTLLRQAIEERTWQAFWRVVVENQHPRDVAEQLAMTVNAVYCAKSRILKRLREEFAGTIDGLSF